MAVFSAPLIYNLLYFIVIVILIKRVCLDFFLKLAMSQNNDT